MKILITGGHHTSALAVISELKNQNKDIEMFFVGHKHSLEKDKNESAEYKDIKLLGIPFYDIKAGKFYGKYNPLNLLKVITGFINAFLLLIKLRPNGIISFGGYIAVPIVIVGFFLGIPSVTHEQTVVSGIANNLISKFVKKVFISWKDSEDFYPKSKVIFSGLPVRKELFEVTTNNFSFPNSLPIVYITGGKQGSHVINEAIKEILPRLLEAANVIHQCGDYSITHDFEHLVSAKASLPSNLQERYKIEKYITSKELGEILHKSNLIVSRAGAHSIYEFIALQKTALLIPISWVSHNEQVKNAELYTSTGLGSMLIERELSGDRLLDEITKMLNNLNKYKLIKNPIKEMDSAYVIARESIKEFSN